MQVHFIDVGQGDATLVTCGDEAIVMFDDGIWSSLVQEVTVKAKDDIVFRFKNGFEVRV